MEKKTLLVIGLIGGILAAVGVFLSWASIQAEVEGFSTISADITGWDMAKGETTIMGITVPGPSEPSPYVVLVGGILALIGAIGALAAGAKKAGVKLSILLAIGGLIAIVGAGWGFSVVETGTVSLIGIGNVSSSYGYGLYMCLVGAILALIGGIMGARIKK